MPTQIYYEADFGSIVLGRVEEKEQEMDEEVLETRKAKDWMRRRRKPKLLLPMIAVAMINAIMTFAAVMFADVVGWLVF